MIIKISITDCIGCGICSQLCPENFRLNENEGISIVISQNPNPSIKEAVDSCPVSAITYD